MKQMCSIIRLFFIYFNSSSGERVPFVLFFSVRLILCSCFRCFVQVK
jgi:hypothetical protein